MPPSTGVPSEHWSAEENIAFGQLGQGSHAPLRAGLAAAAWLPLPGRGALQVSAGSSHACAAVLVADASGGQAPEVMCWGSNGAGELLRDLTGEDTHFIGDDRGEMPHSA
ncbi:hypothetical protein T492DRAFT_870110 [Pavlovales sp. CCMP2436]|nr:hypothetical protein T492DRAFT_870110 [Pavlovales sp. CCMP2436]